MQALQLPALRGVSWLAEGFILYRRSPPLLMMLTLSFLMTVAAFGLIQPIGQFLLPLALPALTAFVANGCRLVDRARSGSIMLTRGGLTSGLSENRTNLVRLGFLHLAGALLVIGLDHLFERGAGEPVSLEFGGDSRQLMHLVRMLVLAVPLMLAFWFAPLLAAWNGVPAAKSLFFSFIAAWRNWRAFLAYGLAVTVIGVLAPTALVIGAGLISGRLAELVSLVLQAALLLVFAPVLMATVYLSYRDVFVHEASNVAA